MPGIPTHCYTGAAVVLGASVAATTMHVDARVPKTCVAASLVSSAAFASALSHHASLSKTPQLICIAGGLGGALGVSYAVSVHASLAKMPTHCKLYSAAGLAIILAGVRLLSK